VSTPIKHFPNEGEDYVSWYNEYYYITNFSVKVTCKIYYWYSGKGQGVWGSIQDLNFCVSFSTPSLQSSVTRFVPSLTAEPNSAVCCFNSCIDPIVFSLMAELNSVVFCCNSCIDAHVFEMVASLSSLVLAHASAIHSFRTEIKTSIFCMILSSTTRDFPLMSSAISLSLSTKFSALLTVPSTEETCFPAVSHVTPVELSSLRSLSTTTLMPCFSHRYLASSRAFACSLALFASSSAHALNDNKK